MTVDPAVAEVTREARVDPEHPWPGLAAFREADGDFFFGRDEEADDLVDRIALHRLTVLFGVPGLGKSSLLQAGVFKRLRLRDYLPVYLRLDFETGALSASDQVLAALASECRTRDVEVAPAHAAESAWEYLHRRDVELWSSNNHLLTPVLVFDQFEEIFRPRAGEASRAAQEGAVELIGDLAEGRVPADLKGRLEQEPALAGRFAFSQHGYRVLLSLREDYLAHLEAMRARVPSIGVNRKRLLALRGDAAARAVVAAGRGRRLVSDDVAQGIVRFVGESETGATAAVERLENLAVAPALLSVVCRALNEERIDSHADQITPQQLERDKSKILQRFYEDSFKGISPAMRAFVEDRFVADDGTRDLVAHRAVAAAPGVSEHDIATLIDRRLIQIEFREGRRFLELTHDRLTPLVLESRDLRRQAEHEAQRDAQRQKELLAQQAALQTAEDRLKASRRQNLIVSALLLVAIAAAVIAGWKWVSAAQATRDAIAAKRNEELAHAKELESRGTAESAIRDAKSARDDKDAAVAEAKRIIDEAKAGATDLRDFANKLAEQSATAAAEADTRTRAAEKRAEDAAARAEAAEARLKNAGQLQEQLNTSKAALSKADSFVTTSVSAIEPNYRGPCPVTLNFTGTIATNINGAVTYRFVRGDGTTLIDGSFESRDQVFETRSVQWKIDNANRLVNGSIRLEVLSPRPASSAAEFKVECTTTETFSRVQLPDAALKAIMPALPEARRLAFLPFIERAMAEFSINTPLRQAAFLAQIAYESGQLRFLEEVWGPTPAQQRYEPPSTLATVMGNTEPGDGQRYKGRGPFVITGRANYQRLGDQLGLDLVGNPQLAAEPSVMFRVAGLFWMKNGLNELADQGTPEAFRQITRRINGGFNGQSERERFYGTAKSALVKPEAP